MTTVQEIYAGGASTLYGTYIPARLRCAALHTYCLTDTPVRINPRTFQYVAYLLR